jgi:PIN domain nuclease of toxin-antitoxin system
LERNHQLRLLLDTHALLWWLADTELEPSTSQAVADPRNDVYVSAASVWEISIKRALGKLSAPDNLEETVAGNGFQPLPISLAHATKAGELPLHHQDPFDRMLIAQAQLEGLTTVTRDPRFQSYGIPLLTA